MTLQQLLEFIINNVFLFFIILLFIIIYNEIHYDANRNPITKKTKKRKKLVKYIIISSYLTPIFYFGNIYLTERTEQFQAEISKAIEEAHQTNEEIEQPLELLQQSKHTLVYEKHYEFPPTSEIIDGVEKALIILCCLSLMFILFCAVFLW